MNAPYEKFNRGEARRGKNQQAAISHDDLQQAIAKYLKSGGRIEKLPEQKVVLNTLVGRRWTNTEMEMDPLS